MIYGLIIVNQTIGHNQYKIDRFNNEFSKLGIKFDVFVNDGTLAEINDDHYIINLPRADFVLYLDKEIYLARILEKAGYRLFNNADFIKICDDKMLTYVYCLNHGIRMIDTMAAPLIYEDKLNDNRYKFLDKVSERLGLPMVVKRVYGSLGEGVYFVKDKTELKQIYSKNYMYPLIFQKYLKSCFGKSVRALVVDHKLIGCIERCNDKDFRSNYINPQGSKVYKANTKLVSFVENIISELNVEYAGIDVLFDENNDPILCEINSNAFFEEFENVTKINVAKLIGEMIIRNLQHE